jgi:menaquinone-specific isochorismate synthase
MIVTPYREDPFLSLHHTQTFGDFFALIQAELDSVDPTLRHHVSPASFRSNNTPGSQTFVSITIPMDGVDPLLAMQTLASSKQQHFYWENRRTGEAIAAIGSAARADLSGHHRFTQAKQVVQEWFEHMVPIGNHHEACAGPRVFCQFTFFDDVQYPSAVPPARLVLPQWQVAGHQSLGSFVANLPLATPRVFKARCIAVWEMFLKLKHLSRTKGHSGQRSSYSRSDHWLSAQRSRHSSRPASSVITRPLSQGWLQQEPQPRVTVSPSQRLSKHPYPARPALSREGRAQFMDTVQSVLDTISHTSLRKAVLAHALDIELERPLEATASLQSLRHHHSDCYLFLSQTEDGHTFLSASPERLLSIQSGHLVTEAIAGSAPRGRSEAEDAQLANTLLHNQKELHEHQLVVNFIRHQLAQLGLNPTRSLAPQILPLSTIQHLQTLIHADIPSDLHPIDMVEALHPTPAVAGVPREMACELIQQHETFERSLYAAPMGWIDSQGNSEFLVGIRSAWLNEGQARLYAGAGIVQGSNPQKELDEIELKLRSLYTTLIHPQPSVE